MTATRTWPRPLIGLLAGIAVGLLDFTALRLMGVQMLYDGSDLSIPVMAVFTATFAALGYANGKLMDAREQEKQDARTIEAQLHELERTQAEMLQIEKLASIGRMAAGVAHEVRNPLGVIRSSAALLVESLQDDDADGRKAGGFIQEEIDRLDAFVRSLLDFSRPIEPSIAEVSVQRVVERVERLSGAALTEANAELSTTLAPELAAWPVDEDLLARAIAALVTNACQAGARSVRIDVRGLDDSLEIAVADDGPGIDEQLRDRLFEPFVTSKTKGTGLGLSMAVRIVEAHGGNLALVDGGEQGARFAMRLPARRTRERAA